MAINEFKIEAYKNGFDNYFDILPTEIKTEVYKHLHKYNIIHVHIEMMKSIIH